MLTPAEWRASLRRRWPLLWRGAVGVAVVIGLSVAWEVYNLGAYAELTRLLELGAGLRQQPWAVPTILLGYIAAGLAFLPLTVVVVATILVYGPLGGFTLATAGTLATAVSGFILGRALGAEPLRRLGGPTLHRLNAQAERHGVMIITALRIMPVAHFHAVSVLAGASRIRPGAYISGTLAGTVPGIAAIAAVGNQAKRFLVDPNIGGLLVLAALAGLSLAVFYGLRRWLGRYTGED